MAILDDLDARLKDAMKARDERVLSTLRMIRSKVMERRNERDFDGTLTDEDVQAIIATYVKQLQKALPDYERAGEAGAAMVEQYRFEVEYLSSFLPALLDRDATRTLVAETVQALGVSDPRRSGQVMGAIMKEHKGRVDPGLVRRFVDEALGGGS